MARKMTLDTLFGDLDGSQEGSPTPMTGLRHSVAIGGANMVAHDPALRSTHIEDLFGPGEERPRGLSRFHSLPTILYSETDGPDTPNDSPKSDGDVKRKSLLEMIDADHPASPSKDTEGTSPDVVPGSPKRRRSLGLSTSPISRPSLIEQETAALARAAALAAGEPEGDDEYGSDTDTVSGESGESSGSMTPPTGSSTPPPKSYAPRASLVSLTARNFERQMRDEAAAAAAFELQQQQQAAYEAAAQAQAAQAAQAVQAAQMAQQQQQQQQLFAMQQQQAAQQQAAQQQQFFAMPPPPQQPQMAFTFAAPHMPPTFLPNGMQLPPAMMAPQPMAPQMFAPIGYPAAAAPVSPPSQSPPPLHQHQHQQQFSPPQSSRGHGGNHGGAPGASPPRGHHAALKLGQTGNLLELAMDKKGSRQLQDGLPKMSDSQLVRACDELGPHLLMLAKHPAANYVVSRLASLPHAHSHTVAALAGHVPELLVHPQGSRVVQAAIAELPLAHAADLVNELRGRVVPCALDTHGSWGVCAAYKRTHAPFILADVIEHIEALSTQQHGCRVVQRVLAEAAASGGRVDAAAARLLQTDLARLAVDPYGNYAVQVAMRHCSAPERARLVGALLPHLLGLSTSKHGSNVAEALLTLAGPPQLAAARHAFFADRATLRELTGHPFGNYVLQAMLRLVSPDERAQALRAIEIDAADTTFGRTIVTHFVAPDKA